MLVTLASHARRFGTVAIAVLVSGSGACAATDAASGENNLDAAPEFTVIEEMRIGSIDDPDYGFTSIVGVDVDRDGNVYTFEASDSEIRVYSPDGELLRRIGRRGEGPGEFRNGPTFGVVGDTIWAVESFGRRISLFLRDGTVISTSPIQPVTVAMHNSIGSVLPVSPREDGLFTSDMTLFFGLDGAESTVGENDTIQIPRVLFDASGTPVDTVGWMPRAPRRSNPSERIEVGGNRYYLPRPPSVEPLSVTLPTGRLLVEHGTRATGEPATLSVTRFDLAGDTVFRRDYSYTPRPFDDAVLDANAWRLARRPGGGIPIINGVPTPPPVPDDSMDVFVRIREAMDFPAYQPPIRGHRLFTDGSLWLMREEDGASTTRWTILAADGSLVGDVLLDQTMYPSWTDGETVWVIARDELDIPWLVRLRLIAD